MATIYTNYYKIYLLFVLICLTPFSVGGQDNADKVLANAKKDVGIREIKSNKGEVQKYVKKWNEVFPRDRISIQSPYCGLAVWYWYYMAGIDPNIRNGPTAISWKIYCKNPVSFFGMTIKQLEAIPKAASVVYKNSYGNHVGIFEHSEGYNIFTYEANTSNARSITKYSERFEGVFYLKTSISNKAIRPIYYCDCINQGKSL